MGESDPEVIEFTLAMKRSEAMTSFRGNFRGMNTVELVTAAEELNCLTEHDNTAMEM